MYNQIVTIVEELSGAKLTPNSFNQHSYNYSFNSLRRKNLLLYFNQMAKLKTRILLVGEAPGYKGCRLTGVPFTSEFILLKGINEINLFGSSRGYKKTSETAVIHKETTATIVWNILVKFRPIPLLWNAFPFHPYKDGDELSNRSPCNEELKIGEHYVFELINLFKIETIGAIGNKAESTMRKMGISYKKVRHPSNGGQKDFYNGLKEIFSSQKNILMTTTDS